MIPENDRFIRGLRAWVGFSQVGIEYKRPERMFGKTTNSLIKNIRWAKKGIRVNCISPAGVYKKHSKKFVEQLSLRIPLGRMAKSHELNGAIIYLCSNASSFVTGHNLVVDGGRTIW